MARTEVRKECPSCGLGVPLNAKVCEFCGWDFEEEDEWISQIEQLEQELMSERQKTDTAKVDRMIKSTLRSPVREKAAEKPPTVTTPIAITVKKKIPSKPEIVEEEAPEEREKIKISAPPPAAAKRGAISIKIETQEEELPPPPEEPEPKSPIAAKPVKPSAPVATIPGKKVRRVAKGGKRPTAPAQRPAVSSRAPAATKASLGEVTLKHSTQKPVAASTATAKPQSAKPVQPTKLSEKKGLFSSIGKMFSMKMSVGPRLGAPAQPSGKPAVAAKKTEAIETKKETPAPEKEKPPVVTVKVFVCPLCNAEVKETEKICPKCGAEFE